MTDATAAIDHFLFPDMSFPLPPRCTRHDPATASQAVETVLHAWNLFIRPWS
ncbi:hypothetical protein Y88_0954 [Novosphingobium nitrogenifigens DSM 19370]|uniref:Uncharacterized protein n=1 Tax=Novosphingobium nitrogenifigens DSM 19370 TaxID=983920 RepID=F1Z987_9SPHN|nr:hypothetical protein Y88_0954 [Novosphingobium nitrogenifigens DSM 19370]